MSDKKIQRPIRPVDFIIVVLDLLNNIVESFLILIKQLNEIAIYHSGRESKINEVWEDFTSDLEKLQEDNDGTAGYD